MTDAPAPLDIALTFDNGPDPEVTPKVLDALAARGLEATFFVLGRKIDGDPRAAALLDRMDAEGHRIANHTYTHETPLGLMPDPEASVQEIARTQALLAPWSEDPPLFRPFGGGGVLGPHLLSPAARDHLVAQGYTCVLWDLVVQDWEDPVGWVDRALAAIRERRVSVLVLHDLPTGAMDRLEEFLDAALAAGARFGRSFPPSLTPILAGRPGPDLPACVAA